MTGPEHYAEAERLLRPIPDPGRVLATYQPSHDLVALAQVHATLALAAATALPPFQGLSASDSDDWARVLGRAVTP